MFRSVTARHVCLNRGCLRVGDCQSELARLASKGFQPNDPVHLARLVDDEVGKLREARFTVLRVPPEAMPEGRIQLLEHHTRDTVWQARWLGHANGIVALKAVLIAVADPEAAAARFGRFAGRAPSDRKRVG